MKHIAKKISKLLFFGSIFVTLSCEVQENYNENNKKQILVEDFSLQSIQGKTSSKLLETANKIKSLNATGINSKVVYNADFDFYIEDEHGKHIVIDGKDSYTFEITRTTGDQKVENIIFNEKENGEFDTFLLKYDYTKEEYSNLTPQVLNERDLSYNQVDMNTNRMISVCVETFEVSPIEYHYMVDLNDGSGTTGGRRVTTGMFCTFISSPEGPGSNHSNGGITGYGGTNTQGNGTGVTTTPVVNPNDPCLKMSKKLDPNEANLAPKILQIQALITPTGTGESGMNLVNVAGVPLTGPIMTTTTAEVNLPFDPSKYGEIHTHPFDCYPMYSFTDIQRLATILSTTAPTNINEVTTILTMPNDAGVMQTYAVTIGDVQGFTDAVNNAINSVNLPLFFTNEARIAELNVVLGNKYDKDNNYERVFLQFFADFNLNVYKANATLTKWNRLTLLAPDFPTANSNTTVISSPCN